MRKTHGKLSINGFLLLDKSVGMTSNESLQKIKRLFNARKAGHSGSLDPIATGLLPLCFGEATKMAQFLLDADKRYWAVFKLGQSTATYDAEGEVTSTRPVAVKKSNVMSVLSEFQGRLKQIPPMYSAVKQGGQALYKLARQGIEVERQPRDVHVFEMKFLDLRDDELEVEIHCSKGTYIRTLAHDIGEKLGCGAHVTQLRRLSVGGFTIDQAVTQDALLAMPTHEARMKQLVPVDQGLVHLPAIELTSMASYYLCQGQPVSASHRHAPGWVRLYQRNGHFLGMGQVLDDGRVAPWRLIARMPQAAGNKSVECH